MYSVKDSEHGAGTWRAGEESMELNRETVWTGIIVPFTAEEGAWLADGQLVAGTEARAHCTVRLLPASCVSVRLMCLKRGVVLRGGKAAGEVSAN